MDGLHLYVLPTLYVLVIWWLSTGIIIRLTRYPRAYPAVFGGSVVAAIIGAVLLYAQRSEATMTGMYLSFLGGILCWGWLETSYYTGYIVGLPMQPCPEGCRGPAHFWHAVRANLYHELSVIVAAAALTALEWGASNQVGLWTFLTLWWAHQVAKLNVFFGVRNLNVNFLPEHLKPMAQFFRERSMNYFFPVSVLVSTVASTLLIARGLAEHDSFHSASLFVLGVLVGLALLELWFLVVPLSSTLWDWSLTRQDGDAAERRLHVDVIAGFLGAGKTSTIRHLLADPPVGERVMVLVNEFGQVGLDGARLAQDGTEVVELPNGCICCTMRGDLKSQVLRLARQYELDRLVIEPSGVANAGELLLQLHDPALSPVLGTIRAVLIVDPARFGDRDAQVRSFARAQVRAANVIVLNKADLTGELRLREIESEIASLAPHARIVRTSFGRIGWSDLAEAPGIQVLEAESHAHHGHPDFNAVSEDFGTDAPFALERLHGVVYAVQRGSYGPVWRTKGLVCSDDGWWQFDGTGEQIVWQRAEAGEATRITLIGVDVDLSAMRRALEECQRFPAVALRAGA